MEKRKSSGNLRRAFSVTFGSLCIVMAIVSVNGCASSAREISAAATPVVINTGLQQANTPDNQQQIKQLLESPAIQDVEQNIGEGVCTGLFNQANKLIGLNTAAGAASTSQPTTGPAAKTPGASAIAGLANGGGINGFVKSSVQEAFLAATDPQFKAGEEAMSEAIGEGFVSGMITVLNKKGPALGDTIRKQIGPIAQDLIREQIAPAVRDMLQQQLAPAALQVWKDGAVETLKLTVRPDLQPDVQQNAQNASIGASHGTHQVMVESGLLTSSGELSPHIKLYLWIGLIVAGLIIAALFSLLVALNLLVLHHWRHRDRSAQAAL